MDPNDQRLANDQAKKVLSALRIIAKRSDLPPSWMRIYVEFRGYDCNTIKSKLRLITCDRTELQLIGTNLHRVPRDLEQYYYGIWSKRHTAFERVLYGAKFWIGHDGETGIDYYFEADSPFDPTFIN